jgi:hypothetical protein
MEETLKNGTSINNPIPLEPDTTTNHGILLTMEARAT